MYKLYSISPRGCIYLPGGVYISQGVYISSKGCVNIYLPRGVYIFQGVYPYISSEGCIISPEILISAHVLFCLSVSLIPKGLNLVMVIGGSEVVLLVPEVLVRGNVHCTVYRGHKVVFPRNQGCI